MGFINQFSTIIDLNSPWQKGYQISVKNSSFYDPFPKKNQYWSFWCHGWFKHPSSFQFQFHFNTYHFSKQLLIFQFSDNFWQDRPMCYVVSLPQFSLGGASINFFDFQQLFQPLFCQPQRRQKKSLRSRHGLYNGFDSNTTL